MVGLNSPEVYPEVTRWRSSLPLPSPFCRLPSSLILGSAPPVPALDRCLNERHLCARTPSLSSSLCASLLHQGGASALRAPEGQTARLPPLRRAGEGLRWVPQYHRGERAKPQRHMGRH